MNLVPRESNAVQDLRNWVQSHSVQGVSKLVGFSGEDPFISQFVHLFIHFTNSENIYRVHPLGCPHQQREGCDFANALEISDEMMAPSFFSSEEENLRAAGE